MSNGALRLAQEWLEHCPGADTCDRDECIVARAVVDLVEAWRVYFEEPEKHDVDKVLDLLRRLEKGRSDGH